MEEKRCCIGQRKYKYAYLSVFIRIDTLIRTIKCDKHTFFGTYLLKNIIKYDKMHLYRRQESSK